MSRSSLLLRRGIRRGLLTLVREREYGTTLGVLCGIAFLAQMLVLTAVGAQSIHGALQAEMDLRVSVQSTASDQRVQEFLVALRSQPFVSSVQYVTREAEYERERLRHPALASLLEESQISNPFSDIALVRLRSLQDYDAFTAFAQQPNWTSVVDPTFLAQTANQEQEMHHLLRLTEAGRVLIFSFLILTAAVMLFVLMELVRRRAILRREEILVERLSGAEKFSVLVPFATEVALLLLAALALSTAVAAGLIVLLPAVVPALASGESFGVLRSQFLALLTSVSPFLLIFEILLVPLLAAAGAYLGMRSQMKGELVLS